MVFKTVPGSPVPEAAGGRDQRVTVSHTKKLTQSRSKDRIENRRYRDMISSNDREGRLDELQAFIAHQLGIHFWTEEVRIGYLAAHLVAKTEHCWLKEGKHTVRGKINTPTLTRELTNVYQEWFEETFSTTPQRSSIRRINKTFKTAVESFSKYLTELQPRATRELRQSSL